MANRSVLLVVTALHACGLGALAGCRHTPPSPLPQGRASFRFIEPPVPTEKPGIASHGAAGIRDVFVQAEPQLPLENPVFPRAALGARPGWTTVAVQLTVDAEGRVTDVRPSFFGITTPSPFANEFLTAVEAAVLQWKFTPAVVCRIEPLEMEGGRVRGKVMRTERVETAFEVAFTFTSTGDVLPAR